MIIQLHDLIIDLQTDDVKIAAMLSDLFAQFKLASDQQSADIVIELCAVALLPAVHYPMIAGGEGDSAEKPLVYDLGGNKRLIAIGDLAHIFVTLGQQLENRPLTAAIQLIEATVDFNRLEDILLICLAPLLRVHQRYMVHAFAAVHENRALLIVGESGSGKTTTGLNLVLNGWRYLTNDVALLRSAGDSLSLQAAPGTINVTPRTLELLPRLQARFEPTDTVMLDGKYHLSTTIWSADEYQSSAPLGAICFPRVTAADESTLTRLPKAIAMAQIMTQSIDQWDSATFNDHMDILQTAAQNTPCYALELGSDLSQLPRLLQAAVSEL